MKRFVFPLVLTGLGVQFRISSFAVRAEVEYFDIEDVQDALMYSIGGSYTF